jgi:hypothetical protein
VRHIKFNLCLFLVFLALCGCMPRDMHVTYGLGPRLVDDDVRFRTTYYFRTFDYCWDADVKLTQLGIDSSPVNLTGIPYRRIIPQTDTLYRYRMTGKASALFNKVRFESGVLGKEVIDPFGTQVRYSAEADGFEVRDRRDMNNDAQSARKSAEQVSRIAKLVAMRDAMPAGTERDQLTAIIEAAQKAYVASDAPLTTEDLKKMAEIAVDSAAEAKVAAIKAKLNPTKEEELRDEKVKEAIEKYIAAKGNILDACPIGERVRKGFQIMGPEGIKTFDQDERLIMAMSSSASPLIETLQEFSGRILNSRKDTTGQLLAIARESARVEGARRLVVDARRLEASPNDIFDQAMKQMGAEP